MITDNDAIEINAVRGKSVGAVGALAVLVISSPIGVVGLTAYMVWPANVVRVRCRGVDDVATMKTRCGL